MKKILSWCGSHTELLCAFFLLGCCISSVVKDGWSVAILFLPFIVMWVFVYRLKKQCIELDKCLSSLSNNYDKLKEVNKRLEGVLCETNAELTYKELVVYFYMYKYLLTQNDVNLCKKKVSITTYLKNRNFYEHMIEIYLELIKKNNSTE